MAKVSMARLEIVTLLTDSKSVVERLQRRGVVDLVKNERPKEKYKNVETISTEKSVGVFQKNQDLVLSALDILDLYAPVKKSLTDRLGPRTQLTTKQFAEKIDVVEPSLKNAYEVTLSKRTIDQLETEITGWEKSIQGLENWIPLQMSNWYPGTKTTTAYIGTLRGEWTKQQVFDELKYNVNQINKKQLIKKDEKFDVEKYKSVDLNCEIQVVFNSKESTGVFVLCHNNQKDICKQALANMEFSQPQVLANRPASEAIEDYKNDISLARQEIDENISKIKENAEARSDLEFTIDYLEMRIDKYKALNNLLLTQNTMVINGYIPKSKAAKINDELQKKYAAIYVGLAEPKPDEDVPVAFENKLMPARAIEDITEDYSMPGKKDIDPNGVMAIFYYMLFGMMFSEGGYGLLMVIGTLLVLYVIKPEGNLKRNMQKFLLCGIWTVFWGALYGSWFGDAVEVIGRTFFNADVKIPALVPVLTEPMPLLIFSIAIGFVHIVVGMGVNFYMLWRQGKKMDAVLDIGLWWLVFLGMLFAIAQLAIPKQIDSNAFFAPIMTKISQVPLLKIGLIIMAVGAVALILTQGRNSKSVPGKILGGVASLYDIAGYLSDMLSYCRLMALGLVTGEIAKVFNQLASMVSKPPVIGVLLFMVVFLFGHAINFGINVLGAYVNCNRLQYVEFLSKFYEGGGKAYNPFGVKTKYYKFKEDAYNG